MKLLVAISALLGIMTITFYNIKKADLNARSIVLVGLFAALTAIGAYIKIPLPYVPFTMQLFFAIMAGILLGSRLGLISQLVYVLIGLIGIPVFTLGGGINYIYQPTFGYLIGFILGAYVAGKIIEIKKTEKVSWYLVASLISMMVIYIAGVPYYYVAKQFYLTADSTFSIWNAIYYGFIISVGGDTVSCILIAMSVGRIKNAVPQLRYVYKNS
ncbi:biotin transporter BioY [Clostridiaceae bacterium M8S5]|nr:biotin transporter BioY [Clostridiaceae bacterium M8S5]